MVGNYRDPATYELLMFGQNNNTQGSGMGNPDSETAWTDFRVLQNVIWPIEYAFVLGSHVWFTGWDNHMPKIFYKVKSRRVVPHYGVAADIVSGDNLYYRFYPSENWTDIHNSSPTSVGYWYPNRNDGKALIQLTQGSNKSTFCGQGVAGCNGAWNWSSRQLVR